MKLILLRLQMLFTGRSTRSFLKILFISFPIILCLMYYTVIKYRHVMEKDSLYKKIEIILEKPTGNNDQTVIHHSLLRESKDPELESSENFWQGTALEPKYFLPSKGKPRP